MDFVSSFLEAGASAATEFGEVLVNATSAVTNILWSTTDKSLTIVGAGLALAVGVGAVYLIFRLVRGLIKQNERG